MLRNFQESGGGVNPYSKIISESDEIIDVLYSQYKDYNSLYVSESCNYLTETEEAVLEAKLQVITEAVTVAIVTAIIAVVAAIIILLGLLVKLLSKGSAKVSEIVKEKKAGNSGVAGVPDTNRNLPAEYKQPKLSIDAKREIVNEILGSDRKLKGWSEIEFHKYIKMQGIKETTASFRMINMMLKTGKIPPDLDVDSMKASLNNDGMNSEGAKRAFEEELFGTTISKSGESIGDAMLRIYNDSCTEWALVVDNMDKINKVTTDIFENSKKTADELEKLLKIMEGELNEIKDTMEKNKETSNSSTKGIADKSYSNTAVGELRKDKIKLTVCSDFIRDWRSIEAERMTSVSKILLNYDKKLKQSA